jgi:hypothetical protein
LLLTGIEPRSSSPYEVKWFLFFFFFFFFLLLLLLPLLSSIKVA